MRRLRPAALGVVWGLAGCSTEAVSPDVLVVNDLGPGDSAILLVLASPDDATPLVQRTSLYRLRVDGKFAVRSYEDQRTEFVLIAAGVAGMRLPAGRHVLEVVGPDGRAVVNTGPVDTLAGARHDLAVFGPPDALQHRWFVDDPAAVPPGWTRVRLLNGLQSRDTIEPLRCPGGAAPACVSLGAPIAHGAVFEIAYSGETARQELKWRPSAPVGGPFDPSSLFDMTLLYPFQTPCTPGTLLIPIYLGPDGLIENTFEGTSYGCPLSI